MERTNPTLAILDPIAFPIAKEGLPWKAAFKLTSSSGREVPNATTVKPITIVDIPYFSAIPTPPLTIHSEPRYSIIEPNINKPMLSIIYIIYFYLYIAKQIQLPCIL
mgnify:FL=1